MCLEALREIKPETIRKSFETCGLNSETLDFSKLNSPLKSFSLFEQQYKKLHEENAKKVDDPHGYKLDNSILKKSENYELDIDDSPNDNNLWHLGDINESDKPDDEGATEEDPHAEGNNDGQNEQVQKKKEEIISNKDVQRLKFNWLKGIENYEVSDYMYGNSENENPEVFTKKQKEVRASVKDGNQFILESFFNK